MSLSELPEEVENYRDRSWCREPELRIEEALAAERFIGKVGFCAAMTDSTSARTFAIRRGLRKARCTHATQCSEGSRKQLDLDHER